MNNLYGFYIELLILTGKDMEPAMVSFKKGLNVVHGPSDTGKTFIFQCIQFLLGKSDIPKRIPESSSYAHGFLQIKTYAGQIYTFQRGLNGGDFKKYDIPYLEISTEAEPKLLNSSEMSDFLLCICHMEKHKARKNIKGETKNITFRMLHNFFMIGEDELQLEMSPIQKNQYTEKTYLENIFKYLITEIDDGNITSNVDDIVISKKKNKLEFLDEIIFSTEEEIKQYTTDPLNIDQQMEKINSSIESSKNDHIYLKELYNKYTNEKQIVEDELRNKKSRFNYLSELLKRANILNHQYDSDMNRLKSTIEACSSLIALESSKCPLCNNEIENQVIDVTSIIKASKAEIGKIISLKNELESTVSMFEQELTILKKDIENNLKIIDDIMDTIEKDINGNLKELSDKLVQYIEKRTALSSASTLIQKLTKYNLDKVTINTFIERSKENKCIEFLKLDISMIIPMLTIIKKIMMAIKFPDFDYISFSDTSMDLVINGKNRQDFGKGFRAVTYAIFITALMKLIETKNYQLGMIVFDSPFVTYRPGKSDLSQEVITIDLAKNFYNYLAENFLNTQVIIIENTTPPNNNKIHAIEFTKNRTIGRYGFIPN